MYHLLIFIYFINLIKINNKKMDLEIENEKKKEIDDLTIRFNFEPGIAFKTIFLNYEKNEEKRNLLIFSVLGKFEKSTLNYNFKNKKLLIMAFNCQENKSDSLFYKNYEMLEFLGDALIEGYIVANAFKMFEGSI